MKTFKRWKKLSKLSTKLFGLYNLCLASSNESEKNLKSLGASKVKFIGNLKFCGSVTDKDNKYELKSLFNNHHIWCASSTHQG